MNPGRENFLINNATLGHLVQLLSKKHFEGDPKYRAAIARGLSRFRGDPFFVFGVTVLLHDGSSPLVRRITKDVLNDRQPS